MLLRCVVYGVLCFTLVVCCYVVLCVVVLCVVLVLFCLCFLSSVCVVVFAMCMSSL